MKRLIRIPDRGRVAGVCAGIADYLDTDVTIVRLAWLVLSIAPGAIVGGLLAYAAAWILIPPGVPPAAADVRPRLTRSVSDRKIAGVCGGLAGYLNVDATVVRIAFVILSIYPGAIVCGLLAYAVAWLIIPSETPMQPVVSPA